MLATAICGGGRHGEGTDQLVHVLHYLFDGWALGMFPLYGFSQWTDAG